MVLAARRAFVDHGYGATTLQQIADDAGVSVQTIYATFGNKRTLLEAALDVSIAGDDEPVAVNDREWMHDVFHHPDAATRLAAYAAACRRISGGAADMFAVVQAAAAVDPGLADLAATVDERRRIGARSIIDGLVEIGALRPGLSTAEAVDILWTLNSPAIFQLLVRQSGWSAGRYEQWLAETFQAQLLAPGAVSVRSTTRRRR